MCSVPTHQSGSVASFNQTCTPVSKDEISAQAPTGRLLREPSLRSRQFQDLAPCRSRQRDTDHPRQGRSRCQPPTAVDCCPKPRQNCPTSMGHWYWQLLRFPRNSPHIPFPIIKFDLFPPEFVRGVLFTHCKPPYPSAQTPSAFSAHYASSLTVVVFYIDWNSLFQFDGTLIALFGHRSAK